MNTLLVELKRSMEELQLGLDGALNMSDKMEALARGIATNTVSAQHHGSVACAGAGCPCLLTVRRGVPVLQVPALWMLVMSTRIQEVYSLSAWYQDVLRRYEQLAAWTSGSLATPHSVWLSGLFNPKAFLTAVRSQLRQRPNQLAQLAVSHVGVRSGVLSTLSLVLLPPAGDADVCSRQQAAAGCHDVHHRGHQQNSGAGH